MIRAAAKNHAFVTVLTDPSDYAAVEAAMEAHAGQVPGDLRQRLAAAAYARTAAYDAAIGQWFAGELGEPLPERFALSARRAQEIGRASCRERVCQYV